MRLFKNTLSVVISVQLCSAVSFAVFYSTLVLYLMEVCQLSSIMAYSIFGVFLACSYGFQFLDGYLGGRLASYRYFYVIAMTLQIIDCLLLGIGGSQFLFVGLALYLVGEGFDVPCLSMILTQHYADNDSKREKAFMWNYASMNLGFVLAYTMAGHFQLSNNFSELFTYMSIFNVVALVIVLLGWKHLPDITTPLIKKIQTQKVLISTLIGPPDHRPNWST